MKYYIFLIISFLLNACSYIFYKYSSINAANRILSWSLLITGLVFGAANATFYTKSLKGIDLNVAYPIFSAFSIILVTLVAVVIFKETLSLQKGLGIIIIIAGVIIVTMH
jgi:Membrane transporters of cations and cationic drugs